MHRKGEKEKKRGKKPKEARNHHEIFLESVTNHCLAYCLPRNKVMVSSVIKQPITYLAKDQSIGQNKRPNVIQRDVRSAPMFTSYVYRHVLPNFGQIIK